MTNLRHAAGNGFKLILFDWLYAFTEFMGRGFFALLLYFGAISRVWGRPERTGLDAGIGLFFPLR